MTEAASHANATEASSPANAAAPARTSLAIEPPTTAEGTDSTVGNGHRRARRSPPPRCRPAAGRRAGRHGASGCGRARHGFTV